MVAIGEMGRPKLFLLLALGIKDQDIWQRLRSLLRNSQTFPLGLDIYLEDFGIRSLADRDLETLRLELEKTEFLVKTKKDSFSITSPLIGVFNVYNIF